MPTTLYSLGNNDHPENGHVLPALIRHFHEVAQANAPSITCWGTVTPLLQYLHVDDLGEGCVFALERWCPEPGALTYLNMVTGAGLSIRELVEAVASATAFKGEIHWNIQETAKCQSAYGARLGIENPAQLGPNHYNQVFAQSAHRNIDRGRAMSIPLKHLSQRVFSPSS